VVKADGLAWCVGYNDKSQLSHDNGATGSSVLTAVLFDSSPAGAIAVSNSAACVITCAETRCAGQGTYGELGNGLTMDSTDMLVTATGLSSTLCTSAPTTPTQNPTSAPTVSAYN
jgi:hypothetical protein